VPWIADQQRAFLPMVGQEMVDIETGKMHAPAMRPCNPAVKVARQPRA
jgi:hypothetical protein